MPRSCWPVRRKRVLNAIPAAVGICSIVNAARQTDVMRKCIRAWLVGRGSWWGGDREQGLTERGSGARCASRLRDRGWVSAPWICSRPCSLERSCRPRGASVSRAGGATVRIALITTGRAIKAEHHQSGSSERAWWLSFIAERIRSYGRGLFWLFRCGRLGRPPTDAEQARSPPPQAPPVRNL
jgi:hypothetical protein